MRRPLEPWLVLAGALAAPVLAGIALRMEFQPQQVAIEAEQVLYAPLLVSRIEEPTLSPERWVKLARDLPEAFADTVAFCRQHRSRTLPNCRNVLTAARADATFGGGGRHAR